MIAKHNENFFLFMILKFETENLARKEINKKFSQKDFL